MERDKGQISDCKREGRIYVEGREGGGGILGCPCSIQVSLRYIDREGREGGGKRELVRRG